jgi:hypothetical protein
MAGSVQVEGDWLLNQDVNAGTRGDFDLAVVGEWRQGND